MKKSRGEVNYDIQDAVITFYNTAYRGSNTINPEEQDLLSDKLMVLAENITQDKTPIYENGLALTMCLETLSGNRQNGVLTKFKDKLAKTKPFGLPIPDKTRDVIVKLPLINEWVYPTKKRITLATMLSNVDELVQASTLPRERIRTKPRNEINNQWQMGGKDIAHKTAPTPETNKLLSDFKMLTGFKGTNTFNYSF